jgi:NAD(P)-dependent dehydrogenase (short-subunit alcohol dehydrogenase family)
MPWPPNVLITGASSGIGAALARVYASPGAVLTLGGRNEARLAAVATTCRAAGATVKEAIIDVTDAGATAGWIGAAGRLDVVIANAGISAGTGGRAPESASQAGAIFATNLTGALNTVLPALEIMSAQTPAADGWRGRIAAVASIAAFIAHPGAPAYCASKAALDGWMVASAPWARTAGVLMTSICPGYVRTPMTAANAFPMPGVMDAARAASIIRRAIARGDVRLAFPWWVATAARLAGTLPARLSGSLFFLGPTKDRQPGA